MVSKGRPSFLFLVLLSSILLLGLSLTNTGVTALGSGSPTQPDALAAGKPGNVPAAARQPEGTSRTQTAGFAGVLTWHNDNLRDGQNLNETILTTSNVNSTTFGEKFTRTVDGAMYAQPLYVPNVTISGGTHNVVYVATGNDSVYAFDADGTTTTAFWKTSFLSSGVTTIPSSDSGCNQISPNIGVTGTPVIDPTTNTLYVVAATKQSGTDFYKLHALDITTGKDKLGGPVTISPSVSGVSFDATRQAQRPGLLLANGTVYIGFGSHCDIPTYHGWLMGYSATTLAQTSAFLVTPKGSDGSLWNGGAGAAADSSGNIFVTTANGTFDANAGGSDYGDSFLKFSSTLSLLDYFTPFNASTLGSTDLDTGSAGVILPPDQAGAHPHIMISAGKEGRIYVVDRDNLGHFHAGSDSQIVQSIKGTFPNGLFTTPAYWNGHVYFAANGDVLKDYTLTNGLLSTSPQKASATTAYPGSTPAVSANGTSNAIVWTLEDKTAGAALRAHTATNITQLLYDSGTAVTVSGVKFTVPTIANGKVYIGTKSELVVFGLL